MRTKRWIAIALILLTLGLLHPGLTKNALTIRGVLDAGGVQGLIQRTAAAQMPADQLAQLRPYLSQSLARMDDAALSETIGMVLGGVAKAKIDGASAQIHGAQVYEQKQTITETIRFLFENGSYLAASLILLFSVCIPIGKALLFFGALYAPPRFAKPLMAFINGIGKWSMADVFLVAIYTAWLAARNSEGVGQPIRFVTEYGPGFYWFTAYCIVSLAAQQFAARLIREEAAQ